MSSKVNERIVRRVMEENDFGRKTIGVDVSLTEIIEAVREVEHDGT